MFNLLRMDLYRLRRSRSVYVCFGLLLAASVVVFVMLWLLAVPQGQENALRIGMLTEDGVETSRSILDGVDGHSQSPCRPRSRITTSGHLDVIRLQASVPVSAMMTS